ncbi:membrane protein of unknown function [Candidatus Saccharimonas aalborgensis]|uniref:CAAX prenyl protease 2/Lysostaphin resistance protein A-like domain-containing protein n=2 Tax=Candidatus Saccharimonas aalborgensis TaxID=1332188 RepID=R4PXY1_9BACT|nr:membrane protein of unknown function [Candidatus Saccharimonas aalborgensis]
MALPLAGGYITIVTRLSQVIGYILIALSLLVLISLRHSRERNYMLWLWLGVAMLAITPIGTEVKPYYLIFMTLGLAASVLVPYGLARRYDEHSFIHLGLNFRRRWTRNEVKYVVFAAVMTAFWQPLYFLTTNAHFSWHMDTTVNILVSFASIMAVGVWEEFFFIALVLAIAKRYLPFWLANIIQSSMFTSFLFAMGFRGWIVPLVLAYALYQGYVFHVTRSLLVTISIHVIVDIIVFISLLYSARPDLFS